MASTMSDEVIRNPTLFVHCQTIYNAMILSSEKRDIFGEERTVYEGFLTKLFRAEGLTVPHYTSVLRELKRMDCIRQLRRGGGSSPSVWILIHPPTEEKFNDDKSTLLFNKRGNARRNAIDFLQQQINDLADRIKRLEE